MVHFSHWLNQLSIFTTSKFSASICVVYVLLQTQYKHEKVINVTFFRKCLRIVPPTCLSNFFSGERQGEGHGVGQYHQWCFFLSF